MGINGKWWKACGCEKGQRGKKEVEVKAELFETEYHLPITTDIKIEIYNILGQRVKIYEKIKQPPGIYKNNWWWFEKVCLPYTKASRQQLQALFY